MIGIEAFESLLPYPDLIAFDLHGYDSPFLVARCNIGISYSDPCFKQMKRREDRWITDARSTFDKVDQKRDVCREVIL